MEAREKILGKASELFLGMGVKNVTMDYIASETGVSKRTIYELFKDKDELVVLSIREMIIRNNKEMIGIISQTEHVIEAIFLIMKREAERRAAFTKIFEEDIKKYFPAVNESLYSNKKNLKEFSASYALLEKGMREKIFRNDIQIELVDNFMHELIGLIHSNGRLLALNPAPTDVLKSIFLPYLRGICTWKGIELMDKYFENVTELL
jgi:AcrR family transcriptional regulator